MSIQDGCFSVKTENSNLHLYPLDELSAVLISTPMINFSGVAAMTLAENCIPAIFCNSKMLPAGILLSCSAESDESILILNRQICVTQSYKKRIWQKIIYSKVSGQAAVLLKYRGNDTIFNYLPRIKSGDTSCIEAQAAASYWRALSLFRRRERFASDANILFNYAYTILYCVFAREIVASGLFPKFGVYHHNRNDPFPLASDLMEPFRPCIDLLILEYLGISIWNNRLTPEIKNNLLSHIYNYRISSQAEQLSLFTCCRKLVQSYKKTLLTGDIDALQLPYWKKRKADVAVCCF